jgi:dolichol kinase
VAIVLPAQIVVPTFLRLALAIAFAALVLIELLRNAAVPPFGQSVDGFLRIFRDDRDPGAVFVTHIYLLLACAVPVWLSNGFAAYAGVLSIGVGDAVASVCGLRYGQTKWPASSKSLEGSLCSLVAQVGCTVLLSAVGQGPTSVLAALPALVAGVVLEAATLQVDNLVVPPIVFAMLVCAEG